MGPGLTIYTILNVVKTNLGWGKLSLVDTNDLSGLGATEKDLGPGGEVSVKELRIAVLYRDPSVISRLYSAYAAARNAKKEAGTDPHALLPVKFGRRYTGALASAVVLTQGILQALEKGPSASLRFDRLAPTYR